MIRVACVGLGYVGQDVCRAVIDHPELELVAAVDQAPSMAGRQLSDLLGRSKVSHTIRGTAKSVLVETQPEVVLLSTTSRLSDLAPQVFDAFEAGASVVSTCEELSYPWAFTEAIELDNAARKCQKALIGVGVNPGYVMDLVPSVLTLPCLELKSIVVERRVDLRRRRTQLQAKAGVGLSPLRFAELAATKSIGHVGLDCSAALIATTVGYTALPLPPVHMDSVIGPDGRVIGLRQEASVPGNDGLPSITLRLYMSMQLDEPEEDRITIDGNPAIHALFVGGIFGDTATAALVVNAIPGILQASPGLHTVLDIPPLRAWKSVVNERSRHLS